MTHWRKLVPWAAMLGVIVGVTTGDYTLLILTVLLLAGAVLWPAREQEDEGEDRE